MWIVAKYKINEKSTFIKNLQKYGANNVKIFCPMYKYETFFKNKMITKQKPLINDYLFCYHKSFADKNILKDIYNIKGLKYFLLGSGFCQSSIINFIKYCKGFEDKSGLLNRNFLEISHDKNYKFTSGPFINLMFKLIEKNKKNYKILVGNVTTVLNKESSYLYQLS